MHLLLLFNRVTLGWYFAFAGFSKVSSEIKNGLGSFYRGDGFQNRNPAWVPEVFIAPYGYVLPWAELIFGGLLLVGLFSRISAGAVALMLLTIGIALMGAGELFPRHHVMVFFSLSLILWVWGGGGYSVDEWLARRRGSR
jgi:uncharacterized membrane protein YphA (DoxX/SURF4 family)